MVSSAVYRYFPSRDELLTALIIDAYDAVADAAEAAADGGRHGRTTRALARVCRGDPGLGPARNRPDFDLVYGSPVPGLPGPAGHHRAGLPGFPWCSASWSGIPVPPRTRPQPVPQQHRRQRRHRNLPSRPSWPRRRRSSPEPLLPGCPSR